MSIRQGDSLANTKNLKHGNPETQFTSGQSAVENGSKGGKASVEARRKKKTLRESMQAMLSLDLNEKEINDLAKKGYNAETQLDALTAAALISAKRGNSQAFANVMKLLGEGVETVNIEIQDDSTKAMSEWLENERETFTTDSE